MKREEVQIRKALIFLVAGEGKFPKRNPCKQKEVWCRTDLQDVMLTPNVDGSDKHKLDQNQP